MTQTETHCICGTELVHTSGIGLYCPNEECEIADGPFDGSEPPKVIEIEKCPTCGRMK